MAGTDGQDDESESAEAAKSQFERAINATKTDSDPNTHAVAHETRELGKTVGIAILHCSIQICRLFHTLNHTIAVCRCPPFANS